VQTVKFTIRGVEERALINGAGRGFGNEPLGVMERSFACAGKK